MFGPLIRFLGATDDDDDGVRRKQQQIQALGAYLGRVQLATASRRRVVESVRQVAEVVVWSDRRSPALLDAVLAAALPQSLLRLLTDARITPDHPIAAAVTVQVLQTLGIVLDGATSTRFIDALLGTNDFVNRLITAPVDLRSDEVLAYYAALLKALALRLTPANIHLFIRQEPQAFPLFAAAAALFDHEDSMVRVAVRAVTLSVIRINDVHAMDIILTAPACAAVWGNVMHALKDACDDAFRVLVDAPQEPRPEGLQRATWAAVDQALEDHMGLLAYINDVCALGVARVNHAIAKEFADRILARTYVHAIDVGGRAGSSPEETLFMQVTTLCIAQFFAIVRYSPLLADTIAALFVPAATDAADAAHKTLFVPLSWRDSSSRTLAPWLCLVLEILANKAISPTVLVKSVLTPHRMLRTRAQLESLTGSGNDSTVSNAADDMDVGRGGSARSVVAAMVHILTELPSSHASSWHTIRLAAHVLEQLTRSSPRGPIVVEPQGLADELLAAQRQHSAELHAMLMSVDDDSLEKSDNDSSNSAWTGQHNGNAAGGYADSVAWKVLAACLFDFANNSPETLRNRLESESSHIFSLPPPPSPHHLATTVATELAGSPSILAKAHVVHTPSSRLSLSSTSPSASALHSPTCLSPFRGSMLNGSSLTTSLHQAHCLRWLATAISMPEHDSESRNRYAEDLYRWLGTHLSPTFAAPQTTWRAVTVIDNSAKHALPKRAMRLGFSAQVTCIDGVLLVCQTAALASANGNSSPELVWPLADAAIAEVYDEPTDAGHAPTLRLMDTPLPPLFFPALPQSMGGIPLPPTAHLHRPSVLANPTGSATKLLNCAYFGSNRALDISLRFKDAMECADVLGMLQRHVAHSRKTMAEIYLDHNVI